MNTPPLSSTQRFGPYIGICVVLVLVLVVAPSRTPDRTNAFAGGFRDDSAVGTSDQFSNEITGVGTPETTDVVDPSAPAGVDAGGSDTAPTAPAGRPAGASSAAAAGDGSVLNAELPSHFPADFRNGIRGEDCSRRKELGPDYVCKIEWEGDNGGSTYKGVTRDSITVVYYKAKSDPAVNAVLAQGGLAMTDEQFSAAVDAYNQYFQSLMQTYGRTVKMVIYEGRANVSPPDAAAFRADAVAIDQEVGAAVVLGVTNPDMMDELARRGIPMLGGANDPGVFLRERAPFIFQLLADGDTLNQHMAEYICKRLGPGSTADYSGEIIHPTIGRRGEVKRKYGLSHPNGYWGNTNADDLETRLQRQCGIKITLRRGYASDINTAGQQATASTQAYINAGITTTLCICDPLAPIFGGAAFTQQNYFPENLMTGYQLQDAEALGRLYDRQQQAHTFGISALPAPLIKKEETAFYKVMKRYHPDVDVPPGAALIYPIVQIAYVGLEYAGPNLNPSTFAEGMYVIDVHATKPTESTFGYTPQDYGGSNDAREIWWDANATDVNGDQGVYQGVNDHWRWGPGEWPTSPTLVFRPECLGRGACGGPSWGN